MSDDDISMNISFRARACREAFQKNVDSVLRRVSDLEEISKREKTMRCENEAAEFHSQ